jgi:hypothetical protein
MRPIEAYREGYEKGRVDSAGGRLAEMAMGVFRDDPGGHFQMGYSDGAAGRAFNPPPVPASERLGEGLIPKFSENPIGWLLGVLIVVEFWALWQLIKAPFLLVGCLMRSEKPAPLVIIKAVVAAVLVIALGWWLPHANEAHRLGTRPAATYQPNSAAPASLPSSAAASNQGGSYVNQRFGFRFTYPVYLLPQGESANGDGQSFVAGDGSLIVSGWGTDKADRTLDSEMELSLQRRDLNTTYKTRAANFFVISGFIGEKILYERTTLRGDAFFGFSLLYDKDGRQQYDGLARLMTKWMVLP